MLRCEQTKGQNVYQHGLAVQNKASDLLTSLQNDSPLPDWRLPRWIDEYRPQLLKSLHSYETIANYTLFHDIGKPFCRVVDEDGKQHFPNHAEVSKKLYLEATGDETTANLIGYDMVFHTASAVEVEEYCKVWSVQDAVTLLIVALSEIHANAALFGGIESQSFKQKFKQLERRGNQVCKFYFGGK
jgi:hypothetical protein